jgi:hypothetical protein
VDNGDVAAVDNAMVLKVFDEAVVDAVRDAATTVPAILVTGRGCSAGRLTAETQNNSHEHTHKRMATLEPPATQPQPSWRPSRSPRNSSPARRPQSWSPVTSSGEPSTLEAANWFHTATGEGAMTAAMRQQRAA